ncbi:MAG: methyltransferase domain-containing protein [Methanophagales archaeon ANME-1-THS]|nr:MAG: methyltransferase domain-containing protein [Methanophagales archaeon ANME-1-THS]
MLLAFELSGEHGTLPRAEVLACLEALHVAYEEQIFSDSILVVDVPRSLESELLDRLSKRLAMTHYLYKVHGMCAPDKAAIEELVNKTDFGTVMNEGETFAVRLRGAHPASLRKNDLPAVVGECITRRGYAVNLAHPTQTFVLLFTAHTCLFCLLLRSVSKTHFEERRPRSRPFFVPGVIMPKVARVLVNLSGIQPGELFLDPFCGTGGILIEAGMVGARLIGLDVQKKMVRGAHANLHFFGLSGDLLVGDATRIPLRDKSIDAIATDLPYGRASFVSRSRASTVESHRVFPERLYQDALDEIDRVLKPKGKAVIVSNSPSIQYLSPRSDFQLVEEHVYRVHKSLNRYITVFETAEVKEGVS